jgi:recombination protein U
VKEKSVKVGDNFEKRLEKTFNEIHEKGVGYIAKVPTSFKIVRGAKGRIVSAFPEKKSAFLDFHGILRNGQTICIEAKSCKNKSSFPFSNFKDYQLPLLDEFWSYNAKCYIIIEMRELKRTFIFNAHEFIEFVNTCNKKSIKVQEMGELGTELDYELNDLKIFIKNLLTNN